MVSDLSKKSEEVKEIMFISSIISLPLTSPLMIILNNFQREPSLSTLKNLRKIFLYYIARTICGRVRVNATKLSIIQLRVENLVIKQPIDSICENRQIFGQKIFDLFYSPSRDDVVIDVGSHVGLFTLKIAQKVKLVVAVEPYKLSFDLLVDNVKRNNLKNIITINAALSDFGGEVKLFIDDSSQGHSIVSGSEKFIGTKALALDKLVEQLSLSKVDFVKINVEGAELNVLKGASGTLLKTHSMLAIAANHYPEQKNDILSFLSAIGFASRVRKCSGGYIIYAFKSQNKLNLDTEELDEKK